MENNKIAPLPFVMTIAGSDPSGGAGIQADLKVFATLGVHGLSALSCTTAQVPGTVNAVLQVRSSHLAEQINLLLETYPVAAVKTGMLYSSELMETVLDSFKANGFSAPLIIDPVIRASSGDALLEESGIRTYREKFIAASSLFTPNIDEASLLLDGCQVTVDNLEQCVVDLYSRYSTPVLLKGGHLAAGEAIDILISEKGIRRFSAPYMQGLDPHGTGCTYSAAITAYIALGHSLEKSVSLGKNYITSAIANCRLMEDGQQFLGDPSF
jgi:hydroxymethylpyrimidine/phosphomethylpyrimidine kinase